MVYLPKIVIFASGTQRSDSGSGFLNLAVMSRSMGDRLPILEAHIVAAVSRLRNGGIAYNAGKYGIPHQFIKDPDNIADYDAIVEAYEPDYIVLSGWQHYIRFSNPEFQKKTINIHPGPLPEYGGQGMYGRRVHEQVLADFKAGKVKTSAISAHFVTYAENPEQAPYDSGPVFLKVPVPIYKNDTVETLESRVKTIEHSWYPWAINLVVSGQISWDDIQSTKLTLPPDYNWQSCY